MGTISRMFSLADLDDAATVDAHCDLMCGVYNPAQARIEAESVLETMKKYNASDDDYFKPPHVEQFPQLHDLFWRATKAAGDAKKSNDEADAQKLLDLIDEIAEIFAETKK